MSLGTILSLRFCHDPPPPPRVLPAVWAALARSTDDTPNSMPDSMLGTEGQGVTTAASPIGVFAKEAVIDEM